MKQIISTDRAPAAIGPYSQAILVSDMLFVSGQIPINPETGTIDATDIKSQTQQVFNNIRAVVEEAGFTMENIVKTTVLLSDMSLFNDMNEVYDRQFSGDFPARAAFAVKALPKGALVEIEVIAKK
jgi:2-iminobutanoate/2-iminopropanoate deaminase